MTNPVNAGADIEKELAEKLGWRIRDGWVEEHTGPMKGWWPVKLASEAEERVYAALLAEAGERAKLELELQYIDATLARRPALDLPTRAENIEKAINVAAKCDAAERRASTEAAANMKLRGDLESLRVKLEELSRQRDFEWKERKAEAERARGLEAQLETVRGIEAYTSHKSWCAWVVNRVTPCSCGLDALLAALSQLPTPSA